MAKREVWVVEERRRPVRQYDFRDEAAAYLTQRGAVEAFAPETPVVRYIPEDAGEPVWVVVDKGGRVIQIIDSDASSIVTRSADDRVVKARLVFDEAGVKARKRKGGAK